MSTDNHASSSELTVCVTEDLVLRAGSYHRIVDDSGQPVAHIVPPTAPLFQQVVEYLEAQPLPCAGSVRLADEARAAVAVCLRWGSYFSVVADPLRPFSPSVRDEKVSHINDDEMARMNIEISAAIQWWLALKGSDEKRYGELLRRALKYLPLGRKTVTRSGAGDTLKGCATRGMAHEIKRAWPSERLEQDLTLGATHGVRVIANTITLQSWRNGPIENVHAGQSVGYALNERRLLPRDEKAIIRQAQDGFYAALQAMEYLVFDRAWPPAADRVLPFMTPFLHPRGWSHTEQSRAVRVPQRGDVV